MKPSFSTFSFVYISNLDHTSHLTLHKQHFWHSILGFLTYFKKNGKSFVFSGSTIFLGKQWQSLGMVCKWWHKLQLLQCTMWSMSLLLWGLWEVYCWICYCNNKWYDLLLWSIFVSIQMYYESRLLNKSCNFTSCNYYDAYIV